MYLFVTSDCDLYKTENINEGFWLAIDAEVTNIIDISDPTNPKQYSAEEWRTIPELPRKLGVS